MKHFSKTNLYLGDQFELKKIPKDWAKVHIGSKFYPDTKKGKAVISNNELYINWMDSHDEKDFKVQELHEILNFIDEYSNQKTFVHCEYAQSRSPAVVMAYLSKRTDLLPKKFYPALEEFVKMYPAFVFPSGITKFLKRNWKEIN
jgi:hypothetical protein